MFLLLNLFYQSKVLHFTHTWYSYIPKFGHFSMSTASPGAVSKSPPSMNRRRSILRGVHCVWEKNCGKKINYDLGGSANLASGSGFEMTPPTSPGDIVYCEGSTGSGREITYHNKTWNIHKAIVIWFLGWRIDQWAKKGAVEKKIGKNFEEILKCHIFASIRPTDKYNHLKWGEECHFFRLEP